MENAPELEKKLGMIFNYEIGPYHYITRATAELKNSRILRVERYSPVLQAGRQTGLPGQYQADNGAGGW
ncbi:MAG: hypothetical protein Ct9H300mP16_15730 [Pseudomonadota bacterium]|nr:MAG: hypothetical protein Ct9H300mP16_15730 [Pseudomonadota bacterium]